MTETAAEALRSAMRAYPTGVTVITTLIDGRPYGFTANAFTSVSLDPPAVLICVNRQARSHDLIGRAGIFCVNILGLTQRSIATHFSQSGDDSKFQGINWTARPGGAPQIPDTLAWIDCAISEEHSVASHTIFVGGVMAAHARAGRPLGYLGGEFHDFGLTAGE